MATVVTNNMEIHVSSSSDELWLLPFSQNEFSSYLAAMAEVMLPACSGSRPHCVELNLVDDAAMADLNSTFLGLPGPTNVLSFPASAPGGVGSLALSVQTVRRESWLYGQDLAFYILKVLAHGLAHLMGYDHSPEMDTQVEKGTAKASILLVNKESISCLN